jgi:hypothetical protein
MKGKRVFKKGAIGNPSGRVKGVPNKTTKQAKELMEKVLFNEIDNIQKSLAKIRSNDGDVKYIDSLVKLLAYVMPKKSDITSDDEAIQGLTINVVVDDSETAETLKKLRNGINAD